MSKTSNILNILPNMSQFRLFWGGKIENFKSLTGVKYLTNSMSDLSGNRRPTPLLRWKISTAAKEKKNCRNFRNFSPSSSDSRSRLKEGGGQPSTSKYFQYIHVTVHFLSVKCECFNAYSLHWSVEVGQSRGGWPWKNEDFFACLCNCTVFFVKSF